MYETQKLIRSNLVSEVSLILRNNIAKILYICTVPSEVSTLTGLLPKVTVFLAMARLVTRKCYTTQWSFR